jgi:hypothetical protein
MLPMVNPSSPQNQLVGVLIWNSLEYMLYQNTDVNVTILHSLDGYDEVSLTGPTKIITSSMEGVLNPADFGVNLLSQSETGDKQLKSLPRCLPTSSLVMNGGPKQCSLCQCGNGHRNDNEMYTARRIPNS